MTDESMHLLAIVLLRLCSPKRAYEILARVGNLLSPLEDRSAVVSAERRIRSRGTCLSRALALASRSPGAELVIGVAPRLGQPLFAHAWLELYGKPIHPSQVAGSEIVRIGRRSDPQIGSATRR
jgi:hypothetical protein